MLKSKKCEEYQNCIITVFTATYNRAYILNQLYTSLCIQESDNFEWLIVDDGSSDNTEELVESWIKQDVLPITYIKQKNGGKHRAINLGTDIAKGEFFFIVDSDDYLVDDAIKSILYYIKGINSSDFAGISGLKLFPNRKTIGQDLECEYIDTTNLERNKYSLLGDKAEVYYTELLRNNKFPEIENEKFIHESIIFNRIAFQGYKIRWFNKGLIICDYISDGLTKNADLINEKNPRGYLLALESDLCYLQPSLYLKVYYYYARYYKFAKLVSSKPFRYSIKQCKTNTICLSISIFFDQLKNITKKLLNINKG